MARVVGANQPALEALYQRYAAAALGLSVRILEDRLAAEDVLQEAFLRVWQRAATFDAGRGRFATWLFTITRRLCIDRLRQRRVRPPAVDLEATRGDDTGTLMDMLSDPAQDVSAISQVHNLRDTIRQALQTLPSDQRNVLLLSYFGGFSRREIAARLGQPEGTVHTRARLGLRKVRSALQALGIDPDNWK